MYFFQDHYNCFRLEFSMSEWVKFHVVLGHALLKNRSVPCHFSRSTSTPHSAKSPAVTHFLHMNNNILLIPLFESRILSAFTAQNTVFQNGCQLVIVTVCHQLGRLLELVVRKDNRYERASQFANTQPQPWTEIELARVWDSVVEMTPKIAARAH